VSVATGLQKRFDWTGVAVGGAVSGAVGIAGRTLGQLGLGVKPDDIKASTPRDVQFYANQALSGAVGAIAGAGVRTLIEGSDFGDNIMAALPDVIGATIGNLIGDTITTDAETRNQRRAVREISRNPAFADLEAGEAPLVASAARLIADGQGKSVAEVLNDPDNVKTLTALKGISGESQALARIALADDVYRRAGYSAERLAGLHNLVGSSFAPEFNEPDPPTPPQSNVESGSPIFVTAPNLPESEFRVSGLLGRAGHFFADNADNTFAKAALFLVSAIVAPVTTAIFTAASYTPGISDAIEYVGEKAIEFGAGLAVSAGVEQEEAPFVALGAFGIVGTAVLGVGVFGRIAQFAPIARSAVARLSLALAKPGPTALERQLASGVRTQVVGSASSAAETRLAGGTFDLGVSGPQYTLKAPTVGGGAGATGTIRTYAVRGFANADEFAAFGSDLRAGLGKAGFGDVDPILQGSAVTGRSYLKGQQPFDAGRVSDLDIALAGDSLFNAAKRAGIPLRSGGTRTGELTRRDLRVLGLQDLTRQMSAQAGRKVNFMVYNAPETAVQRAPSVIFPR